MISIQRLLGKEDMFFSMLEQSASEGCASVQALVKLCKTLDQPGLLEEFIQARRKDKQIKAQITEAALNAAKEQLAETKGAQVRTADRIWTFVVLLLVAVIAGLLAKLGLK